MHETLRNQALLTTLNRTNVELKLAICVSRARDMCQPLNRTNVELKRNSIAVIAYAVQLFESNQCGIETWLRNHIHASIGTLNRTNVELKHYSDSSDAAQVDSFESNQCGIETNVESAI